MKVVDDKTILEVGKFYNVKCVGIHNHKGEIYNYVPVIGILHKDPQLGVDYEHYHVDGRFNNTHTILTDGKTNSIMEFNPEGSFMRATFGKVVIKRKKCVRLTTGINPPTKAVKYNLWYKTMIGKSCAGKKCPHLGTTMQVTDNGVYVCPLHDLHGCPKTETIIAHPNHN